MIKTCTDSLLSEILNQFFVYLQIVNLKFSVKHIKELFLLGLAILYQLVQGCTDTTICPSILVMNWSIQSINWTHAT